MKNFIKMVFASALGVFFGFALILAFLFVGIGILYIREGREYVQMIDQQKSILKVEIDSEIVERTESYPFWFQDELPIFNKFHKIGLHSLQQSILKAGKDENIKLLYLKLGRVEGGWASLSGIYEALAKFKRSGKTIVAYAESYSEKSYYLASLANKIYLYPAGQFEFNGLSSVQGFFKGLFEKLDIRPNIFRVGKFKSAVEPFISEKLSEEASSQTRDVLTDIWQSFTEKIAKNRQIRPSTMKMWVDDGSIQNAEDALRNHLVDELGPERTVLEKILKNVFKMDVQKDERIEDRMISWFNYLKFQERPSRSKEGENNKIALVYLTGDIVDGKGKDGQVGSETYTGLLRKLSRDNSIKAIVLRISSPGGSALASDVIWNEIEAVKKSKPIVATFGDVAASGAYYIASNCDWIVARPNTITGSIGVFGIYMNLKNFFGNKLGVTFDSVVTAPFADMGYSHRQLTKNEEVMIQREVERTYQRFLERVAKGRKFPEISQVASVAEGRIWSGKKAKELGLVDEWGGIEEAFEKVKKMAKLEENVEVEVYPKKSGAFWSILHSIQETRWPSSNTSWDLVTEIKKFWPTYQKKDFLQGGILMLMPFSINIE